MSQAERLARIKHYLDEGRCPNRAFLTEQLGISPATLKRDIAYLRDRLNVPITFDRERGGWRLDRSAASVGTQYELPGLWLTADGIHALLTMQHLLANLDAGGLLGPHIEPLIKRLGRLLGSGTPPNAEVARRIRVHTVGARRIHLPHFQAVGSALLRRQRLVIHHHNRGLDAAQEREVSPQRLIHYRDNWYLDAWCHWRNALRSFSVDAIHAVRVLDRPATDVPDHELDETLGAGYGIFAGKHVQRATLRFSKERARWVAAECWHPNQLGRHDAEGRWLLSVPYSDPRELVMDILRHVPEVEVLGPEGLRDELTDRLRKGLRALGVLDK